MWGIMIITIDGPAGAGKSTLALLLAKKLNFKFFNSGMLFRAYTFALKDYNVLSMSKSDIEKAFNEANIVIKHKNNNQVVFMKNKDITDLCYTNDIGILTAKNSNTENFYLAVNSKLIESVKSGNYVLEGRGLGSFVFKNAELKIYLDCDVKIRAERRYEQLKLKDNKIKFNKVYKDVVKRDSIDKNRKLANLVIPNGALYIDSKNMNVDETLDFILEKINNINEIIETINNNRN